MQKGCILTGLGFSIWRESRVALATAISLDLLQKSKDDPPQSPHESGGKQQQSSSLPMNQGRALGGVLGIFARGLLTEKGVGTRN
jgi:hypothetical protein